MRSIGCTAALGASASRLPVAPHAPFTTLRVVPLPRCASLRGGGNFLLPGQRRNRDVHIAFGVGNDAQILVVEGDAKQAQFVDRDIGGEAGGRSSELGGGRRHALLGILS